LDNANCQTVRRQEEEIIITAEVSL